MKITSITVMVEGDANGNPTPLRDTSSITVEELLKLFGVNLTDRLTVAWVKARWLNSTIAEVEYHCEKKEQ